MSHGPFLERATVELLDRYTQETGTVMELWRGHHRDTELCDCVDENLDCETFITRTPQSAVMILSESFCHNLSFAMHSGIPAKK